MVPTLLYVSETWILQMKNEININAVEMRSLHMIYRVDLFDRICNDEIHRMAGSNKDHVEN